MPKNIVTLFPKAQNVHLIKDVGMIPFVLHKAYAYQSTLVCMKNGDDYSYINTNVKGLKLCFLKGKFMFPTQLCYIIKCAKKIDILNMYHMSIHNSLFLFMIYKVINPKGITYLKLDLDYRGIKSLEEYSKLKKSIVNILLKFTDLVSAESEVICKRFFKTFQKKIICIPNGYYDFWNMPLCEEKREKVFLTVGRLGTKQKASELLVEAFLKIFDKCEWKLVLIGSITAEFEQYLKHIYTEVPQMRNRIIYKGMIQDKKSLMVEYRMAKVFILPSRWEGFPLVSTEALSNGCYMILTDSVPPAEQLTDHGKYGEVIPTDNVEALAKAMLRAAQSTINHESIMDYARENYSWINICAKLNKWFVNKMV